MSTVPAAPSLRPDALAGREVLLLPDDGTSALPDGLAALGARLAPASPAPDGLDLLVVDLRATAAGPPAESLTRAFTAVRDVRPALAQRGGAGLFLLPSGSEPRQQAVTVAAGSLARSLAQEWAGAKVRVNCLAAGADGPRLAELVALFATPAAAMLTGQVIGPAGPTAVPPEPVEV